MPNEPSQAVAQRDAEVPAAIPYADASVATVRGTMLKGAVTRGDVAALALRLFAVYLLLQAITMFGYLAPLFVSPRAAAQIRQTYAYLFGAFFVLFAGGGTWLFIKASRLASWLLPRETANPDLPAAASAADSLQPVAFSVVGLYVAATGAAGVFSALFGYFETGQGLFASILTPGMQVAIGMFLFFKSKRVALFWQRIGHPRPPRLDDDDGPL